MQLSVEEVISKFGEPGKLENLKSIELPYPFYLDWDLTKSVNHTTCHKDIAEQSLAAFNEILSVYGLTKIHELGIDQFGGCFNFRPQRGYETQYNAAIARGDLHAAKKYLSRHSWAIAYDFDPNRNLLKETKKTARFARPEYKEMFAIFYKHGFIGYGPERDNDWMHIEFYKPAL